MQHRRPSRLKVQYSGAVPVHRFKDQRRSSSTQKIRYIQMFVLSVKWNRGLGTKQEKVNIMRTTAQPQNNKDNFELRPKVVLKPD